jgi:hypothetical protein
LVRGHRDAECGLVPGSIVISARRAVQDEAQRLARLEIGSDDRDPGVRSYFDDRRGTAHQGARHQLIQLRCGLAVEFAG